jgi:GntR family transcriptional repressor for pyruvate dehydrogenase complex
MPQAIESSEAETEMKLKAVSKGRTLVQMVVDQILTYLAAGKLKPGDTLPVEYKLAKTFNIGTSTIREAMRILETKGVVEIVPRKGVLIRSAPKDLWEDDGLEFKLSLHRKHLPNLLESWLMHIVVVADLACQKRILKDLQELKSILIQIKKSVAIMVNHKAGSKTYQNYIDEHVEFFSCLAGLTSNLIYGKVMRAMMANLYEYLPLAQIFAVRKIEEIQNFLDLEQKLVLAIEKQEREKTNRIATDMVKELKRIMLGPQEI